MFHDQFITVGRIGQLSDARRLADMGDEYKKWRNWKMVCKYCGKEIREGLIYCPFCGCRVAEEKREPEPEVEMGRRGKAQYRGERGNTAGVQACGKKRRLRV